MKNKSKLNNLKSHYFKLPDKIHKCNLSATAIAIYSYLAKCSEEFNPSVKHLSKTLNISQTTVCKYMKELKDRNVIKVIKPGYEKNVTQYEFCDINKWT